MKITTLLLLGLLASNYSFGQTFVFTFTGNLDVEKIQNLEQQCSKSESVSKAKFKYKEDSERGELIIILEEKQESLRPEADNQFSPIEIKKIMIDNNLSLLSFRKTSD